MGAISQTLKLSLQKRVEAEYDKMEKSLVGFAKDTLNAAIRGREGAPGKHNFTGNLLNSIVTAVYRRGKLVVAYYSSGVVKGAIHGKMKPRKKKYSFSPDYDGAVSWYRPEMETDGGYGANDAVKFVQGYKPKAKSLFEFVCAYTTEYAEFVEMKRQTTGFLETYAYIASYFYEIVAGGAAPDDLFTHSEQY